MYWLPAIPVTWKLKPPLALATAVSVAAGLTVAAGCACVKALVTDTTLATILVVASGAVTATVKLWRMRLLFPPPSLTVTLMVATPVAFTAGLKDSCAVLAGLV